MPSGKQSKRRRRAVAPPPPARRRQASPRVLIGAAVLIALAAAGVVLALALRGGGSTSAATVPARGSLTNGLPGASDVQQLLKGIPQDGNVLGSPSAPVTMVAYVDLQCPYCQEFETQVMPTLIARYVRTRKLRVEARTLAFIGSDSERGRTAAIAAGEQNKQFNFMQLLYLNQGTENTGWLSDDMVTRAAASIPGLDVPRLLDARSSGTVSDRSHALDAQANTDDVRATPTILVGRNGRTLQPVALSSPTDKQSVARAIDAALA